MTTTLTDRQRDVLMRIDVVRDQQIARLLETCPPEGRPTEYVSIDALVRIHKQDRRVIDALVRKGHLEIRQSNGWGPEVRRRVAT